MLDDLKFILMNNVGLTIAFAALLIGFACIIVALWSIAGWQYGLLVLGVIVVLIAATFMRE